MNRASNTGLMTIRLTRDNRFPAAGVEVQLTDGNKIYNTVTDQNGRASFNVETPPFYTSQIVSPAAQPFTQVNILISAPGYVSVRVVNLMVFPLTETTFTQNMILLAGSPSGSVRTVVIPTHHLARTPLGELPQAPEREAAPIPTVAETDDEGNVYNRRVIVPEYITVHMGPPSSDAQNITVPYLYYLKSVASSEIYPTWPTEALKANILAQNTLALNRIYTEWYRSQGYPFQITSSPAYDQYYVHDAGIFDTVSVLVDELFDQYISRPNDFAPIYSEYCDGVIATCDGMTQWGTVSLARQGMDALEILRYYYGQNIELRTAEVVQVIPDSYPGELSEGSTGADVTALQTRLNRIAINYPAIPFIRQIDGVYGAGTENAVRAFQQSFGLPATGVTDENTWYRIIYIYTAVTRLAELTSEGERPVSDDYPGRNLTIGSRGIDVLRMQYYLRVISEADPNIPATMIDGVFDVDTRDAVYAFQRDYGLVPTGVIDEATWNKIVNAYYYVLANAEVSEPYPGEPLSRGSQGASVLFIQTALNAVSQHVPEIPSVADDGIFGPETERAVRAFQSYYGLTVDGIVGPETWRLLALEMGTSRDIGEPAKG